MGNESLITAATARAPSLRLVALAASLLLVVAATAGCGDDAQGPGGAAPSAADGGTGTGLGQGSGPGSIDSAVAPVAVEWIPGGRPTRELDVIRCRWTGDELELVAERSPRRLEVRGSGGTGQVVYTQEDGEDRAEAEIRVEDGVPVVNWPLFYRVEVTCAA